MPVYLINFLMDLEETSPSTQMIRLDPFSHAPRSKKLSRPNLKGGVCSLRTIHCSRSFNISTRFYLLHFTVFLKHHSINISPKIPTFLSISA